MGRVITEEKGDDFIERVLARDREGYRVLCPVCGERLLIVHSRFRAWRLKTHPGVYCPRDRSHVYCRINMGRPRR